MELREIVAAARSRRRFHEERPVPIGVLRDIVDTVRLVPSSVNLQPLRYAVSVSREMNARIFPLLGWAGLLRDWPGPALGERPPAYIILGGEKKSAHLRVDLGIACQTIFLLLAEAGLSGCMIGNVKADAVRALVGFPDDVDVLQVMAVGYASEKVVVDEMAAGGKTAYYRDADGTHHVPKRPLREVLLGVFED